MAPKAMAATEPIWVQVRNSVIRSQPQHFASGIGSVKYGDKLTMLGTQDNWVKVKTGGGATGYIPVSSVSAKVVALSVKDAAKSKADPSDVVLAGKGFSKDVENQYKQSSTAGRYDLVDKVEKGSAVTRNEVAQFVRSGGLKG